MKGIKYALFTAAVFLAIAITMTAAPVDSADTSVYGSDSNGYGSVVYDDANDIIRITLSSGISEMIDCDVTFGGKTYTTSGFYVPSTLKFGVQADLTSGQNVGVALRLANTLTQLASWSFVTVTEYIPSDITLTAGSTSVEAGSTTTITATPVYDEAGVASQAKYTSFTVEKVSGVGSVGATTIGTDGKASATFTAGTTAGTAVIKATVVTLGGKTVTSSQTITITVTSGPTPPGPGPGPTPTTNYTVTFAASPTNAGNFVQGTTVVTSIQVASGTAFTVTGNVMTFGSGTTAKDVTAVASAGYEFDHWSDTSGTITADKTITAVFKEVAQPITKTVANGSVTLPASVVEALGIKDASKLVLTIEKVTPKAGNIPSDAVCYEVTLKYDGKALTSFPSEIDVLLKYAIPAGESASDLKVFYVSDDGKTVENMNGIYDAGEQGMFFKTRHLSVFAVTDQTIAPVTVSSISVKTAPSKVSYTVGDKFDPTGLVITATYSDGKTEDVSYSGHESAFGFVPSLSIALKVTDKSITITYEGKSTSQAITVSEAPSPSGGGYDTMMYVIIAIVVIVLIAAVAFFVIKKRP